VRASMTDHACAPSASPCARMTRTRSARAPAAVEHALTERGSRGSRRSRALGDRGKAFADHL
jgi:hypothetical protein